MSKKILIIINPQIEIVNSNDDFKALEQQVCDYIKSEGGKYSKVFLVIRWCKNGDSCKRNSFGASISDDIFGSILSANIPYEVLTYAKSNWSYDKPFLSEFEASIRFLKFCRQESIDTIDVCGFVNDSVNDTAKALTMRFGGNVVKRIF